jgi:hypothetical protein
MAWVKCVKCGFSQIPAEKCLRCAEPLPAPRPRVSRMSRGVRKAAVPDEQKPPRFTPAQMAAGGVLAFGLLVFLGVWMLNSRPSAAPRAAAASAPPTPTTLDLSGRWTAEVEKTLQGPPPRPAIKSAFMETTKDGQILAAGVLLTDPGRGGAGAGYRMAADGRRRLDEAIAMLSNAKASAVPVDFIPFPPWVPARERVFHSLEAPAAAKQQRKEPVRYLLLESLEDDYLVQAGINETGFLSYVFASPAYGKSRGVDTLSRAIHPEPGSSLRGFENLVWDLSGSADFLKLEVNATVSGPDGISDRLKLKR